MAEERGSTQYARAGRADSDRIRTQVNIFAENEPIKAMAEGVGKMVVILNHERQIVYANSMFLDTFSNGKIVGIIGQRPGEAVNCMHSDAGTDGCGTSEFCRSCGAINAILESQSGTKSEKECQITTRDNNALDLRINATPYESHGDTFTIFAITDISDAKRRHSLERIFFHDILNSASGIHGLSSIMRELTDRNEITVFAQTIQQATNNLIDEIRAQLELTHAERGDLVPARKLVLTSDIIKSVLALYENHDLASGRKILIDDDCNSIEITTDPVLLRRVIGNMVKNALEASAVGEDITISCTGASGRVRFSVNNISVIDPDSRLLLFRRSFTTKGFGRGIGTYSMKLLGEKYLGGKVWFTSDETIGTTFYIEIATEL
jgi:nitrogen fixation/metabolism regulation signal transduction histidine kinase